MKTTTRSVRAFGWKRILGLWIGVIIGLLICKQINPSYWRYDLFDAIYFTGYGLCLAKVALLFK